MNLKLFSELLIITLFHVHLIQGKHLKSLKSEEIMLDTDGKYNISWELDEKKERVTFNVNVETTGYIGLGVSPNGGMKGADFFIGGVDDQGNAYHQDRYLGVGAANGEPLIDAHDDWTVLEANEKDGFTKLKISRLLNTCDEKDYPITENGTVRLIWAIGSTDLVTYHVTRRGSKSVNIFEAEEFYEDTSNLKQWKMTRSSIMPSNDTSYWCTIHKRPSFNRTNHIVGFDAFLEENSRAKIHTHHFIIYKCNVGQSQFAKERLEEHVGGPGEDCYYGLVHKIPKYYCREYLFVWAVGGKATWFPKNVGYPVAESEDESPYYMMEIHYDNPELLENVSFEAGVIIYHTDILREHKAGLLTVGNEPRPSLVIPPNETNFIVTGHCDPLCSNHFPHQGISVFNILLHSHLSGRKLKLRHIRDNVELPWMLSDDSYDFNFQQSRAIKEHIKVYPGDHLLYECVYDSTWNDNKIVYGGLSTRNEMCQSFLWYYPQMPIGFCGSTYSYEDNFGDFGITNHTAMDKDLWITNPIILAPEAMAGFNYSMALSTKFQWTDEFRKTFQKTRRFGDMDNICADRTTRRQVAETEGRIKYPDIREQYVPEDKCPLKEESPVQDSNSANSPICSFSLFATIVLAHFYHTLR